jgi:hypothetical protein
VVIVLVRQATVVLLLEVATATCIAVLFFLFSPLQTIFSHFATGTSFVVDVVAVVVVD